MRRGSIIGALVVSVVALAVVVVRYQFHLHPELVNFGLTVQVVDEIPTNMNLPQIEQMTTIEAPQEVVDSLPRQMNLEVAHISQYPELPTGCEVTALAQVLNYMGYPVDKLTLARNYLPQKDVIEKGCYVEYFYGSPERENGSGCFGQAIVTTANSFLRSQGAKVAARSISYSPVEILLRHVADGSPVIVWTSLDISADEVEYVPVKLTEDSFFYWPRAEHCVVLSGYDLDGGSVTLVDPTHGEVKLDIVEFTKRYQKYYYQAVVIE